MRRPCFLLLAVLLAINCHSPRPKAQAPSLPYSTPAPTRIANFDTSKKVIHVFVALCDNKYQGIVPVPPSIGNGQDPNSNLYWGCDAGVRTYFRKSSEWQLLRRYKIDSVRLERLIFKHKTSNYYLVADAYDGRSIRQCTVDFLSSCAGQIRDTLSANGKNLGINGNARLLCYIGHDGLMDFRLADRFQNKDGGKRDAIILACISKKYFSPFLLSTGANPLIWTTGLMCPEAYTLHDAVSAYIRQSPIETIRYNAVKAYARGQHCSEKAAKNLLVSGW
jgi:hypothetical protein